MGLMEIFAWPLGWIMWFFYNFLGNHYVLSLILFTIVIRALLVPSAVKQQKSSAKMVVLQPKLQALQKKYGNNKQKLQEEQMKLYEQEGYNPMGGCLPMLIQLPVIYGLFNVVYNPITHLLRIENNTFIAEALNAIKATISTSSPQITLIKLLNNPDTAGLKILENGNVDALMQKISAIPANIADQVKSIDLNFLGLNFGEIPTWTSALVIIPILSGVSALLVSLLSTKLAQRNNPTQQGGGMLKGMMLIMPLLSLFIAFGVPAGVGFYWIVSNILAGVQSYILYKIYTPEKMAEIVAKEKELIRSGKKKQKKSFMAKMSEAQQAQAANSAPKELTDSEKLSNKEKIAAARKRMAEKYGEEYDETED